MVEPATITIRYFGIFSQYTCCTSERQEHSPGSSLDQLVVTLCERHGQAFTEALQADLDYRSAIVSVNGEMVSGDTTLRPDDEVVISYPAGGG